MIIISKGVIIGIGKILPGISGAMIAIMLGEYEKIINSIASLGYNTKEKIVYLSKIGVGIIIGISSISKIIVKCINKFYFLTMLLFTGLIICDILKSNNPKKSELKELKEYRPILLAIITIIVFIIVNSINKTNIVNFSNFTIISLIIIGVIESIASIIPGISGTAIFLTLGCYNTMIETFSDIFNYERIIENLKILVPFFFGFITGTIIICKILFKIIKKEKDKNNIKKFFEIISIYFMIKTLCNSINTKVEILIGIIAIIVEIIVFFIITPRIKQKQKNKI